MNILGIQYTLKHKSLDIYLAGCCGSPHCEGCHNPESWDFNNGEQYNKQYFDKKIRQKISDFNNLIDNIMIFGGEPNDQIEGDLHSLLTDLKVLNKHIWVFTRYDIKEVPTFELELCDYIKTGRYIPKLTTEDNIQYGIKLATSNQKIYRKGIDY
jgi:anaerobic ribonucleoside-triphosphate reductase activating protein